MNRDDLPTDPFDGFADELGERLHTAADGIDGGGVTRAGIASAVDRNRRRTARTRAVAVGVAAAVALLGGLAIVAAPRDDGAQHLSAGEETTTSRPACSVDRPPSDPAGWFRLSEAQATALEQAGAIGTSQADLRTTHAVLLSLDDLQVISDPPIEPYDDQVFDLGYEDAAGIELLRSEGRLTETQEAAIADGIAPVLDQEQADRVFEQFPDLDAIAAGGQPFPTSGVQFSPGTSAPPAPAVDGGGCGPSADADADADADATTTSGAADADTAGGATTTIDPRRPSDGPAPVLTQDAAPGERLWAVYLDAWTMTGPDQGGVTATTSADGHTDLTAGEDRWWAAEARASEVGYLGSLVQLACDEGWDGASGSPQLSVASGSQAWAVAVYFRTEADATAFAELLPGDEAGLVQIRRYCTS